MNNTEVIEQSIDPINFRCGEAFSIAQGRDRKKNGGAVHHNFSPTMSERDRGRGRNSSLPVETWKESQMSPPGYSSNSNIPSEIIWRTQGRLAVMSQPLGDA